MKKALISLIVIIIMAACMPVPVRDPSATPLPSTAVAPTQSPEVTEQSTVASSPSLAEGQLLVSFAKEGDLHLWDSQSKLSRIIGKAGDVTSVTMSDDGQAIVFTRRAWVGSELEGYEQFSLWAVNSDGANPREVIPAEFLRQRLNLTERESSNFYQLGWVPHTHELSFSITKYIAQAEGMSHAIPHGAYVVNIDSGSVTVLAEPPENLRLAPSPDGTQFALLSPVSLSFINSDGSNRRQDVLTYPAAGLTGPLFPTGVWTADSSAFVLTGSFEMDPRTMINFTFWRVPVDGSAPVSLASVLESDPNSVTFSPDGKYASYLQATDGQPPEIAGWSIVPFDVEAGPLAIPYFGKEAFMANLHWSPAGQAYAIKDHDLVPLCPDATQDTQVCGEPVSLGIDSSIITLLQWVDNDRFLVAGIEPNMLVLGKRDGTFSPIVIWEDNELVNWGATTLR